MRVAYKNTQISYVVFFVFPNCMFNVQCKNRKLLLFSEHNTTGGTKFGRGYWNTNFTKSNKSEHWLKASWNGTTHWEESTHKIQAILT